MQYKFNTFRYHVCVLPPIWPQKLGSKTQLVIHPISVRAKPSPMMSSGRGRYPLRQDNTYFPPPAVSGHQNGWAAPFQPAGTANGHPPLSPAHYLFVNGYMARPEAPQQPVPCPFPYAPMHTTNIPAAPSAMVAATTATPNKSRPAKKRNSSPDNSKGTRSAKIQRVSQDAPDIEMLDASPAPPKRNGPQKHGTAHTRARARARARKGVPKVPPNAYIIFRSDYIRKHHVKSSIPGAGGLQTHISGIWNAMSAPERAVWYQKHAEAKEQHRRDYPHLYVPEEVGSSDDDDDPHDEDYIPEKSETDEPADTVAFFQVHDVAEASTSPILPNDVPLHEEQRTGTAHVSATQLPLAPVPPPIEPIPDSYATRGPFASLPDSLKRIINNWDDASSPPVTPHVSATEMEPPAVPLPDAQQDQAQRSQCDVIPEPGSPATVGASSYDQPADVSTAPNRLSMIGRLNLESTTAVRDEPTCPPHSLPSIPSEHTSVLEPLSIGISPTSYNTLSAWWDPSIRRPPWLQNLAMQIVAAERPGPP